MNDLFGRNIDYLRLSVTDLCDLRCVYCMDPAGVEKLAHGDILSFEGLSCRPLPQRCFYLINPRTLENTDCFSLVISCFLCVSCSWIIF